jgi:L-alanine-DL-glutamate epimerase-like enolase superfamily enzyme
VRTDVTVSLGLPEAMAEAARERAREGFDVLKLKLGDGDVGLEVARVVAVSRAVGPGLSLRLDANQAWTAKQALAVLERLEGEGIRPELLEQPVPAHDLRGMAAVTRHSFVPVLADESVQGARDVLAVAGAGAADLVNVKLAKCGGLRAAQDVVAVAQACGLGTVVGCMLEPPGALAAGTLLAMTLPEHVTHDLDALWWVEGEAAVRLAPPMVITWP